MARRGALLSCLLTSAQLFGDAQQPPTFRSSVEYVQLDAVVTDKDDRPVGGLTQADFEIVERGRAQTIASFQFVSIPSSRRSVADVKAAAPTIDVASNVHSPTGRQWVLVIDDLHIIEQHLLDTKKVVQAFLESLPADDQVAIVFVGRSDLSQDFTSDLGAQIRTVDRIKASLGFAYDAADGGGGDAVLRVSSASTDVLKNVATALGPDGGSAIVTIAIRRDATVIRGTHATVAGATVNARTVSRAQQAAVDGSLSLRDLTAGDYTLEIEARLTTGAVARRSVSFAVK